MRSKTSSDHCDAKTTAIRRVGGVSLRTRFYVLCLVFSIAIVVLAGLSYVGFQALSGARAYVHGESQWAKAQQRAVFALLEYSASGRPAKFERFREALEVIHGDRRARLTLQTADPDIEVAREGFLAGRNHPEDIDLMIWLFQYGGYFDEFSQAVEVWVLGDERIGQLEQEAEALRSIIQVHGVGAAEAEGVVERIIALNHELTQLGDRFAMHIGRLAHQLAWLFTVLILSASALLIFGVNLLGWRLTGKAEQADRTLRESEQRYRALVDQPGVGMWHLDRDGRIVYINPAMRELMGIAPDADLTGVPIDRFVQPKDRQAVYRDRLRREKGEKTTLEVGLSDTSGRIHDVLIHGAPVMLEEGWLQGHVGTCLDISDRKLAEQKLRHQAFHDALTDLPNRLLFMDRLEMALRRASRSGTSIAVLFVDLDRFKVVNDSLGHVAGDQLLREAAHRIGQAVRGPDTIARLGGDEFGLIVESVHDDSDAIEPARRIVDALKTDFELQHTKSSISASIGIALSSIEDGANDLLRFADIAMYVSKRRGGGQWHIFDREKDAHEEQRLHLENELWEAVDRGELVLHYQPIVKLDSGRVHGVEALVRWEHPRLGLLVPGQFIPIAEENGAISRIGRWVVRRACKDLHRLKQDLGANAPAVVCINISAAEFRQGDPLKWIGGIAEEVGVNADELCFEVTESLLTQRPKAVRELERQGFHVAIDDFGTGYASLDLLRQVRFSIIKIDRTFVHGVVGNRTDQALVEFILHLGEKLGMKVIAEGVETEEQARMLRQIGFSFGQGYLFSRPVDIKVLQEELASR